MARAAGKQAQLERRRRATQRLTPSELRAQKRADRPSLPEFFGPNADRDRVELRAWRRDHTHATRQLFVDPLTIFPAGTVLHRKLGIRTVPFPPYTPPAIRRRAESDAPPT